MMKKKTAVVLAFGIGLSFTSLGFANEEDFGHEPDDDTIAGIRDYIDENFEDDIFASLHLQREDVEDDGVILLSFTEMISEQQQEEIEALTEDADEVEFREVDHTEQELMEKQAEVNEVVFEEEQLYEFNVWGSSVDIQANTVEILIEPFNEENARELYDEFGDEMITVVEGEEPQLDVVEEDGNEEPSFLQSMWRSVVDWWNGLF